MTVDPLYLTTAIEAVVLAGDLQMARFGQDLTVEKKSAIDLCYVAGGRLDGFWETDLKAWDIAGGALIVSEAGGRVTNTAGEPFRSRGGEVLATNGHLHDAMLSIIRTFRAGRAPKVTN